MEVALVLVVRVEARVRIRAHEIATGTGRLQQRDVIDVHAGRLGRVEDVRHVDEDGDVLAHSASLISRSWVPPARSRCAAERFIEPGARWPRPRRRLVPSADLLL